MQTEGNSDFLLSLGHSGYDEEATTTKTTTTTTTATTDENDRDDDNDAVIPMTKQCPQKS